MRSFSWFRDWLRPQTTRPIRRLSRSLPRLEQLEGRDLPSANLVTDLNFTPLSSSFSSSVDVNGTFIFTAFDGDHGRELWKSDGTAAGTTMVKDIGPGAAGCYPTSLTNVNGALFFVANLGNNGFELWKSDGTETGTVLVKDLRPGTTDYTPGPSNLTNVNGTLFFTASDNVHGRELWKSDGTTAGTMMVKDIRSDSTRFDSNAPRNLTNVNGTLFFTADNGASGRQLWKSDGTAAGTVRVKDISPGSSPYNAPSSLTNVNGTLFFSASDGVHGNELWKSDGTLAGTVQVKDITPGSRGSFPSRLTSVNGTLFFLATDFSSDGHSLHGGELWKSDGTEAGTVLVKDIMPGVNGSVLYSAQLTNVNGTLFFCALDGVHGGELWKSDGTEAGTVLVKDIVPGPDPNFGPTAVSLANVNGTLFFAADDGIHGRELWKSDGTAAGTVPVKEINPGRRDSIFQFGAPLTNVNGTVFFAADDGVHGRELWKSDGTEAGTVLVKDIDPRFDFSPESVPEYLTDVNGTLYFFASDRFGAGLYKTDGTAAGTVRVKDSLPGGNYGGRPSSLTNANGRLFYRELHNSQLWTSDGTPEGTVAVFNNSMLFSISNLTAVNDMVYFGRENADHGGELWKSDGTAAGTVMVKAIGPGSSSFLDSITNVNGTLYFTVDDGVHGRELWVSDGTSAGTVLVKDITPGGGFYGPGNLANANGTLYFTADDGVHGRELWKSDGTTAGTVMVKDIFAGSAYSSDARDLTNVNGTLYFSAVDGYRRNLWKSDGTAAGTVVVKDINPIYGSNPTNLTNVNGKLFFAAADLYQPELWVSDGTTAGTIKLTDVASSGRYADPREMTNVNGQLFFFTANELWTSDGTIAGTLRVQDSLQSGFQRTASNGSLFFSADDGVHGYELWRVSQALQNDRSKTPEGTAVQINVLANDFSAPGSLPVVTVSQPVHGSGVANANGTVTYTPVAGFNGVDSFTYTVTNRFGDTDTATVNVTVLLEVNLATVAADLQSRVAAADAMPPPAAMPKVFVLVNDPGKMAAFTAALAQLTVNPAGPVIEIVVDVGAGAYGLGSVAVPTGLRLVIDGVSFAGSATPALKVLSGEVAIRNRARFTSTGNASAIQVTGGQLTIRNSSIEETAGGNQAAISISGGLVDLGTSDDPGGNTITVHGKGLLLRNTGPNNVPAVGNIFSKDGTTFDSDYRIEDAIDHALDGSGGGTVFWVPDTVFVSANHGSVLRGVDVVPAGSTVYVETGVHGDFSEGAKLLTIAFQDGSSVTQQVDSLDPSKRTLVVVGTYGNDAIKFGRGGDQGVRVEMNHLAKGTFLPTGRLIAYELDGGDNIEVSNEIYLSAWLYGGYYGTNRLKGGGGNDVLIGGYGDDTIIAGAGRDLLIGDGGADHLNGTSGSVIFIGGYCAFAGAGWADETALDAVMAEWSSGHEYTTRVNNLANGGGLNGDYILTAYDDGAVNVLDGGTGQDLFFASLIDTIKHRHPGETVFTY